MFPLQLFLTPTIYEIAILSPQLLKALGPSMAAAAAEPRRNVKLLCSFGGRILPRPSDGALRYAGGHTRILSVPRDLPFPDLMSRLADARGGVGPTVVKYQLPSEDLDALISVSCPEDLDNMMDEYEKLADSSSSSSAAAAAGAARLRVFLFTPAELSSADSISPVGSEQRYFDAVNGIVDGVAGSGTGSLGRKDSGVISNSDCEAIMPSQPSPMEENLYGGVNYRAAAAPPPPPPLSQFPPLPHTHHQQLAPQNLGPRFEDCYMCQKALPHAHSDPTTQDFFNGSSAAASRVPLYSQWSEDAVRLRSHSLADNVVEPKVESFPQVPVSWYENDSPFLQKIENPNSTGLALDDAQSSYEMFLGNFPPQNVGLRHYPVQQHREGAGATYDYAKYVNGMMEGLRLSPTEVKGFNGQGKPVGMLSDSLPSAAESYYGYIPQVGDSVPGRGYVNDAVVPEGTYVRHIDQLPLGNPDLSRMHNLQPVESGQPMGMAGQLPHHLVNMEPPIPSESLLGMPTYAGSNHPAYSERSVSTTTLGDLRVEPYQIYPHDTISHLASSQGSDLSNDTSLSRLVDPFQEPASSDSLFCNQDPRTVVGGTTALPPRPKRVASKESILPKDSGVQVHLGNSTESDIIALLEEGGLHPSSDSLEKALNPGSAQRVKVSEDFPVDHACTTSPFLGYSGYGEEQVKQDLQAVAEGVASSVLNTFSPPGSALFTEDGRKIAENNAERTLTSVHQKLEDNKTRESEKIHPTFQITDDLGRLQMIHNSDLEELRELGSGTFGTVYHGKWRGTDVAIKRINERCFAGKPSEKERMRADFWNEASNLADLHHPNVVAFYGVVLDGPGGSVATVTEYMVNGSLRNALQRTLDRRKRLVIAMDVAFGMEYLHKKNIVHFDLKSDNLLVNLRDPQRPICKVGDLGLSKVKCQTLISGGVRGTLPWMAPELLNGSSNLVSEKVDVFSFGIVMWELLTGEEPYADLHYGAIIGGIVSNTLRPPVPESCEPQWRSLMEKCWSADPSERPSFTEVADRLRSIAASIPRGQVQGLAHK